MFSPRGGKNKGTWPAEMSRQGVQRHNPASALGFVGFYLPNPPFQPFPEPCGCLSRAAQGLCASTVGRPTRMLLWPVPFACAHKLAGRLLLSVDAVLSLRAGSREQPAVKINERGTMPLMSRNSAPARKCCSSAALSYLPARLCSRSDFIPVIVPARAAPCAVACACIPPSLLPAKGFTAPLPDANAAALPLLSPTANPEPQQVIT